MGEKKGKIGVLLVNLGTPDAPTRGAVYRFLKQFLLDYRVIDISWLARNVLVRGIIAPFRSGSSSKLYKQLWTPEGSPLKTYSYKLLEKMKAQLGDDYEVALSMRYQSPSIESGLEELRKKNVRQMIILPLFPHYASASTGSVMEEVMRLVRKWPTIPEMSLINSYYDDEAMLQVYIDNAKSFNLDEYDHILFSFHGIPQRQLTKSDTNNHCLKSENCCETMCVENQFCYSSQSYGTAYKIAEMMNIPKEKFTVSFQSRLGNNPWTQPYTIKKLEQFANEGMKKILVFSPAFVSDCLETTIEISYEYQEEFVEWGGEQIDLVPSLNDNDNWVKALVSMVEKRAV